VSTVTAIAGDMEDLAFFRLAHSTWSTALLFLTDSEVLLRGRVIAIQARLARHLGDLRSASSGYEEVARLGTEADLPELTGRSWVGLGILAQLRGDFPEARRRFHATIELAGATSESVMIAHNHLMVAAATARDYDTAASHGWQAFKLASTPLEETESLANLAQLLLDAGYPRAALRGFAAALARNPLSRQELPILGGAAFAAAAALPPPAARALVRNFGERVDHLVAALHDGRSLPYPSASALVEISEAYAMVGEETCAGEFADRAESLASVHGFHQLMYRLENPVGVAKPVALAPATEKIVAAVDELEGAELVGAAS
jgi:tetratricopeptide (TPR) repeat protein